MKKLAFALFTIALFITQAQATTTLSTSLSCSGVNNQKTAKVEDILKSKNHLEITWANGYRATYQIEETYLVHFQDATRRYQAFFVSGDSPVDESQYPLISLEVPSSGYYGGSGTLSLKSSYFATTSDPNPTAEFYMLSCD